MEIPRHWRLKAQRYRLEGSACPICGEPIFPLRPVCAKCHFTARPAQGIDDELRVSQALPGFNNIEAPIGCLNTESLTG